ncbi:hypothetical protein GRI58_02175 [Porphyrobacter algicida]|uniref:Flagella basal body P-ring formation protein FlgA SAF domain-containing protein n=1 Tax=Qipengyuania algicida TaxID=1836209 RepID=A0A845AKR1_9SPHN|nr:flagella basal body P-ring formation protein FlgA [Qipengyuania algicida]MXP27628.1 hypothetical protein [Qipengyuania algicida]
MTIRLSALAAAAMAFAASPALAGGTESPADLDQLVAQFTGALIGQPGGAARAIDARLKLARCVQTPVASWYGSTRRSVRIDCPTPGGWTVYVPLMQVEQAQPVVSRGDLVSVEVSGQGFMIAGRGEALAAGAPGDVVSVRTEDGTRKGRTISGRVLGPGRIGIALP